MISGKTNQNRPPVPAPQCVRRLEIPSTARFGQEKMAEKQTTAFPVHPRGRGLRPLRGGPSNSRLLRFVDKPYGHTNIEPRTCIVRNTAAAKGRTRSVAPGATAARHLHYGRIILDAGDAAGARGPGHHETGLVCLERQRDGPPGAAELRDDALRRVLHPAPRRSFDVAPGPAGCDLAELSAPVDRRLPAAVRAVRGGAEGPRAPLPDGRAENAGRDAQHPDRQERRRRAASWPA